VGIPLLSLLKEKSTYGVTVVTVNRNLLPQSQLQSSVNVEFVTFLVDLFTQWLSLKIIKENRQKFMVLK
jgi:hypothetical protein